MGRGYLAIKEAIRCQVLEQLDHSREATDAEIRELIDNVLLQEQDARLFKVAERRSLAQDIFYSLRRLDILQALIDDSNITEIMINGLSGIYVEKEGKLLCLEEGFQTAEALQDIIQRMVAGCNRAVNEASPIVDARLDNGARVNIVLPPVAINGPIVTIRRFPDKPVTMEQLIAWGSVTREAAELLHILVAAGYNIFISGGTGSGKTTFLNVLSGFIPAGERIITIEDSAELQLLGIRNLVRLETRNENVEGCRSIGIRELIRTSLRMRPDRIIVGEVRGSEAIDMMQCLNTGHDGSMSTGHANSAADMLSRLETMILMGMDIPLDAIKQQIASGIDILVHLGRLRDGTRRILEIAEVDGYEEGNIRLHRLFGFIEKGEESGRVLGRLEKRGELIHEEKLKAAGLVATRPGEGQS